MSKMTEKVRVTRRDGRIWKVECLDRQGNVLCELPLVGLNTDERVQDETEVALVLNGRRVIFAEKSDAREPNVVELPRPDDRVDDAQPADPTVIPLPPRAVPPPAWPWEWPYPDTQPFPYPLEPRIID